VESEYNFHEEKSLKSFLLFAFLIICLINIAFSINSSYFRVKTIEINSISSNISSADFSNETLNQSIWLIDSDTFNDKKIQFPTIENITITKEYPNKVTVNIIEYEELIVVTDLRGTIPFRSILYKNGLEVESSEMRDLPTLSISNGPVQTGFNGELVSMMMTLKKYTLNESDFSFNYDGQRLTGEYRETLIDFGPSIDLGTKGAALGALLENSECSGEIRFIGSEEIIANC
tara:strand:+ start:106 stop:801 length:696 start_codon:yes stop_codon:yes gene_type:complete